MGPVAGGRRGLGVRCARRGGVGRGRGKSLGGHAHRGCLWLDHPARASVHAVHTHAWHAYATGHGAPCHACVQSVRPARAKETMQQQQRAGTARRGTAQHRLANNAGRRTGAASPALASDTSLLHRRWHCQTQHAAHGYTTKQGRLAFRLQSACICMPASGSVYTS